MKKILLYSTLALGVGLCSCSQEDLGENPAQAVGQPVTVSVQLPGEVGSDGLSRAVPEIPADHQLRCILYVSGETQSLSVRKWLLMRQVTLSPSLSLRRQILIPARSGRTM